MRSPLRRAKRLTKEAVLARAQGFEDTRKFLAHRYLRGSGVEIGALHFPLPVPKGVRVKYVDRLTVPELREHYPELAKANLVEPDLIDDGERLSKLKAGRLNFVIANHFIEHTENPLGAIKNHLRVLKPGGVIFMGVPDKRHTFDKNRPLTPVAHLAKDYRSGPAGSRRGHYREWASLVLKVPPAKVAARANQLVKDGYSIHFHTWIPESFAEMLLYARNTLKLPLELQTIQENHHEFIVVVRKTR